MTGALAGRIALAGLLCAAGTAAAQTMPDPQRGRLLYETHCIACHTTQLHWRDRRQARDWPSLKGWVEHWQKELGLGWSERDTTEVARHLNERYYRYPQSSGLVGALTER